MDEEEEENIFLTQMTQGFCTLDNRLEKLEVRINALTNMFLYFMQTFFYVHPEIQENYEEELAFANSGKMLYQWFSNFSKNIANSNLDFFNELKTLLLEENNDEKNR